MPEAGAFKFLEVNRFRCISGRACMNRMRAEAIAAKVVGMRMERRPDQVERQQKDQNPAAERQQAKISVWRHGGGTRGVQNRSAYDLPASIMSMTLRKCPSARLSRLTRSA